MTEAKHTPPAEVWLRDAGSEEDECWIVCAKGDPGSVKFSAVNSHASNVALIAKARQEAIEECARVCERDADWIRRDGESRASWERKHDPFTLPAEGIPWDQIGRWSYTIGILAGSNIASSIRALKVKP